MPQRPPLVALRNSTMRGPVIILPAGLEDLAPAVVDLAENAGDHAADLVARRTGLGRPRLAIGLVGRRLAAAGQDFGAADQDARIDAEGIADQAEHDDGADAEPATAHRQAETAATATARRRHRRDGHRCRRCGGNHRNAWRCFLISGCWLAIPNAAVT